MAIGAPCFLWLLLGIVLQSASVSKRMSNADAPEPGTAFLFKIPYVRCMQVSGAPCSSSQFDANGVFTVNSTYVGPTKGASFALLSTVWLRSEINPVSPTAAPLAAP